MSHSRHTSWQDFLVAGLLALLTGRELLKELHAPRPQYQQANGDAPQPRSANGHLEFQAASTPDGVHLPNPSIWPMVLGAGLSLLLFGVVTSYAFIAIGVLLIVGAVGGWIGDLLHADSD